MDDFYLTDGGIVTVNSETADVLDLDPQVFADFGKVITVTTTEE